jgi:hypothetical protein
MSNPPNNPMVIAVTAAPSGPTVCMNIKGEVDPRSEPDRDRTLHHPAATGHRPVYADLTASPSPARPRSSTCSRCPPRLRTGSSMLLGGTPPMTRRIVEPPSLDQICSGYDCPPAHRTNPSVVVTAQNALFALIAAAA